MNFAHKSHWFLSAIWVCYGYVTMLIFLVQPDLTHVSNMKKANRFYSNSEKIIQTLNNSMYYNYVTPSLQSFCNNFVKLIPFSIINIRKCISTYNYNNREYTISSKHTIPIMYNSFILYSGTMPANSLNYVLHFNFYIFISIHSESKSIDYNKYRYLIQFLYLNQ